MIEQKRGALVQFAVAEHIGQRDDLQPLAECLGHVRGLALERRGGRGVARFEQDGLFVDTCAISDSEQPYETAVGHPLYNSGELIIVEMYDTREDAAAGHVRWVETMTATELPTYLRDVSSCGIKRVGELVGAFPKIEKHEKAD